jgi:hypothetical protein
MKDRTAQLKRQMTVADAGSIKPNYVLSQAKPGRFYAPDSVFSFPIYLGPDVDVFLSKLAEQKQMSVQGLVNNLLHADMQMIQSVQ